MTKTAVFKTALSVTYTALMIGIVCWVYVPGFQTWVRTSIDWARYYRGVARWRSRPSWLQEAMVVRGFDPPQVA